MQTVTGAGLLQAVLDVKGVALLPAQTTDLENILQTLMDAGQGSAFALADVLGANPQIAASLVKDDVLAVIVNQAMEAIEIGVAPGTMEELAHLAENLKAAKDVLAAFLTPLALDTDYNGDADVEAGAAAIQDVLDAQAAVDAALAVARDSISDAWLNAAYDNAVNNRDAALTDLLAADLDALAKIAARDAAAAELAAKADAQADTADQVAAALAALNANGLNTANAMYTPPAANVMTGPLVVDAENEDAPMIDLVDGELEIAAAYEDVSGILPLLTAVQADVTAIAALAEAQAAANETAAVLDVNVGGSLVTDYTAAVDALEAAGADVDDRQKLIDDAAAAADLKADTEALDQAVTEAVTALEDAGYVVIDFAEGAFATENADLFIFTETKGQTVTITGFGQQNTDYIYFGDGHTPAQLPEDKTIEDRVGDAATLEILWEQDGADLILYVEADPEAGRDLNTNELTTICLVGVDAADMAFDYGLLFAAGPILN